MTSQSPESWRASASVSPELNIMILSEELGQVLQHANKNPDSPLLRERADLTEYYFKTVFHSFFLIDK